MGPLWDFNLAIGNLCFYGMHKTSGWLYLKKHSGIKHAFWFKALVKNKVFRKKLIQRYFYLRQEIQLLSDDYLSSLVDFSFFSLKGSSNRDHITWRNTYTLTEKFIMSTWEKGSTPVEHLTILKKWLRLRLKWIDKNIDSI